MTYLSPDVKTSPSQHISYAHCIGTGVPQQLHLMTDKSYYPAFVIP